MAIKESFFFLYEPNDNFFLYPCGLRSTTHLPVSSRNRRPFVHQDFLRRKWEMAALRFANSSRGLISGMAKKFQQETAVFRSPPLKNVGRPRMIQKRSEMMIGYEQQCKTESLQPISESRMLLSALVTNAKKLVPGKKNLRKANLSSDDISKSGTRRYALHKAEN